GEQAVGALDVEEGLLLSSEASRRQVLRGRRTPDGEADVVAILVLQPAVAVDDLEGPSRRDGETRDVTSCEAVECTVQRAPRVRAVKHEAVGVGRDGEPVRNTHAVGGELAVHLADGGGLAPDERDVAGANLLEGPNVDRRGHATTPLVMEYDAPGVWVRSSHGAPRSAPRTNRTPSMLTSS